MLREPNRSMAACVLAMLLCASCGDDSEAKEPEPPEGEPCAAAGLTENCSCSPERPPGIRSCLETKLWGQCTCPPQRDCAPGQRVRCALCEDETERRIVTCSDEGTYDCSCSQDGAGSGGGDRDGG